MARKIGNSGNNALTGTDRNDLLSGRAGNDTLKGLDAADILKGGDGNDKLLGGKGTDVLKGGAGDDLLRGGPGNDGLFGGKGDDVLQGGGGEDRLTGGDGADTFVLSGGDSFVEVTDFSMTEGDTLDFNIRDLNNIGTGDFNKDGVTDTVLELAGGSLVVLEGIKLGNLLKLETFDGVDLDALGIDVLDLGGADRDDLLDLGGSGLGGLLDLNL